MKLGNGWLLRKEVSSMRKWWWFVSWLCQVSLAMLAKSRESTGLIRNGLSRFIAVMAAKSGWDITIDTLYTEMGF